MRDHLLFTLQSNCLHRLMLLGMVVTLLLICNTSCAAPVSDPAFEAIRQALQSDDKSPEAAYSAVRSNLSRVKDRQIIPLLLDYLKKDRHRQTGYPGILREVVFYLERISDIKSHVKLLIGAIPSPIFKKEYLDPISCGSGVH
jgi:hypothetical protein